GGEGEVPSAQRYCRSAGLVGSFSRILSCPPFISIRIMLIQAWWYSSNLIGPRGDSFTSICSRESRMLCRSTLPYFLMDCSMAGTTAYLKASAARLPWTRTGVFQRSSQRFSHSGSSDAVQYVASTTPSPIEGLSL